MKAQGKSPENCLVSKKKEDDVWFLREEGSKTEGYFSRAKKPTRESSRKRSVF